MSISINKKYSFEISINSPTILVRNHSQLNQLDYESSGHTGFASSDEFSSHIENTNNPHSVTKTQVGLENVEDGAQINIIEIVNIDGVDLTPDVDKRITLPNKEPAFAKNTAFNKNFGSEENTVTQGNDARLSDARTPLSHTHDDRYYTESEIDTALGLKVDKVEGETLTPNKYTNDEKSKLSSLDTQAELDIKFGAKENTANKGVANGYAPLNANGIIDPIYVPGAYTDYVEYATYDNLPASGVEGTLYVVIADETSGGNTSTYRWTGSVYVNVTDKLSASEVKALYESNANTNAYTDDEKSKLSGIEPNAEVNTLEAIKVEGESDLAITAKKSTIPLATDTISGALDKVDKAYIDNVRNGTQSIPYDNTTSGLDSTTLNGAIDEIDGNVDELETRTTVIESKLNIVGLGCKEYGVREIVGQSASNFERVTRFGGEIKLGSATGLVANVAIDDADATNSFDYIPIFKREVVDIDATDLSSNTVSNTFVKVPKFYIKEEWVTEGETEYHYIFMSQFKHEGYRLPLPFRREDGTERDYTYIGAYEAYLDGNNKLRSLTGQIPKVSYSRNSFRTAARAVDGLGVNSKYQITDLAEYVDLVQIPFMIEFATKHSQGVFAGATSMAYSASHTAIADGTAVNFIVVSNATGAAFVLGQTVSIGTSNSNDSIAKDRIITQIDVDTPNAGETTITFDGAAVNITIGHVIASRAWKTGMTDSVKVSGTHALNDGKHSIVWRGLENPFGNIWKNVDGVKISNWRGYVAENPKDYNDTASVGGVYAEPYLPLGYLNANANNYIQELGFDQNYPYAKFPISVQASSGLYFRDYYYQNTGDRTVFVGGNWAYGSDAGLFFWFLGDVLGNSYFNLGARLSYRP